MNKQCPNCVVELVPNKKKLGIFTNWLICTKCGYRERDIPERKDTLYPIKVRDKINALGGRLKMAE